jgi:hypothetical protein
MTESQGDTRPKPRWYRRRATLVAAVVVVVVAITVITDLPVHTSRASDISVEQGVMAELNPDLAPCAYAVHEALGIWGDQLAHTLSAEDEKESGSLLSDDQQACSFTDESIYDLSNIEVPGSPAGKDLGDLVATSVLWTTSDALQAIEAVQTLMVHGHDASALTSLAKAEDAMAADRAAGLREVASADHALDTTLARPDMPAMPTPKTS